MEKRFGALSSSVDPNKLSMRVNGVIMALSGTIIWAAGHFLNITLTPENVVELAGQLGGLAGALATVFGVVRWCVTTIAEKKRE